MDSLTLNLLMRDGAEVLFKLCAPLVGAAMVIGFVVSLLQAVTQVQEPTLSFVPKLIALLGLGVALTPWMGDLLGVFTLHLFEHIGTAPELAPAATAGS